MRRHIKGPHLFKRGQWYYARIPGRTPVEQALGTDDAVEAQRRFELIIASPAGAEPVREAPEEETLVTIVDRYLSADHDWTDRTANTTRIRVCAWLRWVAGRGIALASQMKPEHIDEWLTERRATPAPKTPSSTTLKRDFVTVRKMLAWARERRYCGTTPFAGRKPPRELRRVAPVEIPSPGEVARVVKVLQKDARAHVEKPEALRVGWELAPLYVQVALATGFRVSDMRALTPDRCGVGTIHAQPGKGKAERVIRVDPTVAEAARQFAELRAKPTPNGRERTLSDRWINWKLRGACKRAKVPEFTSHDLRRTFATECYRSGIPLTTIQDWLGHKSAKVTQSYLGRYRTDAVLVAPAPKSLTLKKGVA